MNKGMFKLYGIEPTTRLSELFSYEWLTNYSISFEILPFKAGPTSKANLMCQDPAAIFVDFKFVINFKFDDRKEPAVQVAELNTRSRSFSYTWL
jgi:hypothetical protein